MNNLVIGGVIVTIGTAYYGLRRWFNSNAEKSLSNAVEETVLATQIKATDMKDTVVNLFKPAEDNPDDSNTSANAST